MANKSVIVSNTGFMGTNDLLEATGTASAFDNVIIKIGNALGMKQDEKGKAFIFSKLDDLTAFINAQLPGTPTLPEVKVVIQEWIDKQAAERA